MHVLDLGVVELNAQTLYNQEKVDLETLDMKNGVWPLNSTWTRSVSLNRTSSATSRCLCRSRSSKVTSIQACGSVVRPGHRASSRTLTTALVLLVEFSVLDRGSRHFRRDYAVERWGTPTRRVGLFGIALLIINSSIGLYEQHGSGNAARVLIDSVTPRAKAKRSSVWPVIDLSQLVPGNITAFKIVDSVPADFRLSDAHTISMD
ncbi:unnamed protein product [Mycena citricolor]|uniref:Uncharacterized protein n=1 Tax=Mycena citricolor TaxID=2018698 RepID=A0AAD2K2B4_9AGAR|nr:unnamed protein product [Mycena citricolor]CAK5275095.1 unnamed protein product [Mycena citricolor]